MNTRENSLMLISMTTVGATHRTMSLWPSTKPTMRLLWWSCNFETCWDYECYLVSEQATHWQGVYVCISGSDLLNLIYTTAHPNSLIYFPVTPFKYSVYCLSYLWKLLPPGEWWRVWWGRVTLLMWGHCKPCWLSTSSWTSPSQQREESHHHQNRWEKSHILLWSLKFATVC